MKKLILISLLAVLMSFGYVGKISAQYTVETPRRTTVYCTYQSSEWTPEQKASIRAADSLYILNNSLDALIIGNPSRRYNCHFYAWYLSENTSSGLRYNMPASELYKYLESERDGDESYLPSDTLRADKIIKGNIDDFNNGAHHSMDWDRDDTSDRDWVSKTDENSLVRHSKYDSPYNAGGETSTYHHYADAYFIEWVDPYIEGLGDLFCEDSSTFKIVVDPHFYLTDAYTDGKLDYSVDHDYDSIKLKRNSNLYGDCVITLEIANGCGETNEYEITVSLGSELASVWGYWQDPVCMCAWNQYGIRTTYHPSDMSFDWQFMYGDVQDIYPYHIMVTPYMDGGYVTLVATNGCGVDTTINVYYPACGYCPDYYMVYPNPSNSSDIIYIETTKEALDMVARAKDIMENLSAVEAANIKLPNLEDYDYQILSKMGEVKMNGKALGGKVILNVSHLKPGVYYVVIDSGTKPETHELIIN